MIGRISDTVARGKTDRLTGAFNMDVWKEELRRLLGQEQDGYLLLVDVDDQKSINLKNGQEFGDQVLKRVAEALEAATGGEQRIYRTDGDCFAVNLPGKSAGMVMEIFAQLRCRLKECCTLSGGCVPFQTYKVPDVDTLFQYAENSVDYAKANGKDTLWFFSADDYEKDWRRWSSRRTSGGASRGGLMVFPCTISPRCTPTATGSTGPRRCCGTALPAGGT